MTYPAVSYQGIPGSFSYLAMQEYFNGKVDGLGQRNFKDIFTCLVSGKSNLAIVPVENSLAGSVYEVYDLLFDFNCHAVGEHYHKVNHNLLTVGSVNQKLEKVFSHPKALEQCLKYFEGNPDIEKVAFSDTAGAAKYVADSKNPAFAAIASKEAAKLYGLHVSKENLEDNAHNFTRFLVLDVKPYQGSDPNKCSLIFTLPHTPQSLFKAMEVISDPKININKIQSRPIHGKPFEYAFYIDFEFASQDYAFAGQCLENFAKKVNFIKNLGFYKKAQI